MGDAHSARRPTANPRHPGGAVVGMGRLSLCRDGSSVDQFNWGTGHVLRWKLPERLGGGRAFLFGYKDAWVRFHRHTIERQAEVNGLPAWALAGVVWNEVGGDPGWIDDVAYGVRAFDHLADPALESLTTTRRPELTSMGDVSIQLRRAAQTMGLEWSQLSGAERADLRRCLIDEPSNLAIVARHLRQLTDVDFPGRTHLSDGEVVIVGARYNRGPHLSLDRIREDLSYGQSMLKRKDRFMALLGAP